MTQPPSLVSMLHIMKLCVGVADPAELRAWQAERLRADPPLRHLTRHMPRRAEQIVGQGSLYWVIAGTMLLRQRWSGSSPRRARTAPPAPRCCCTRTWSRVRARPVKAFQGWRYLRGEDAPDDLAAGEAEAAMPFALAQHLRELCLL